jgi:uncharacterized protein (TIGR03435 family)
MRHAVQASCVAVIAAVGIFLASASAAQPPPAHFEAAAIKPGTPNQIGSSTRGGAPGGQYQIANMPLRQWVEIGLSVQDYALKAPSWLDTSRFDLNAKLPNQPVTETSLVEMMRTLLIERFGLKWHEEPQTVSGYELVVDKKLLAQPATLMERLRGPSWGSGPTLINGTNLPMSKLAELLGTSLGRPVVDATHLSGGYDIQLRWQPTDDAALASERQYGKQYGVDVDNLPGSASTALREKLGLRLQPAKVAWKIIVIDHIDTQPTPN